MRRNELLRVLRGRTVIPAARTETDFAAALATTAPLVAMLFGSILSLPRLIAQASAAGKFVLVHLDLLEGVGKDRAGVKYLAQAGAKAIISTKQYLVKAARDEGILCVQRMFLMDSDSLRTGIELLRSFQPDALEVLPGTVPRQAIEQLAAACDIPIFAGGLITTLQDLNGALANGAIAVSTSKQGLWEAPITAAAVNRYRGSPSTTA